MIIETKGLTKAFGQNVALQSVSLEFQPGATGLLGPNGAGKTTLLRVLLGLLPAEGSATVLGLNPMRQRRTVRARIGYMPESECLIPGLNAVETVTYMGRLAGMSKRDALKRAHEILYFVRLGEARYRDATEYSMGMQQRLKLATALVHDPDLLFLDEPTNGLDPKGRVEMLRVIAELPRAPYNKHVILSSHLLKDVEEVCTNVAMLKEGRLVKTGPIAELTGAARGEYEVEVAADESRDAFVAALGGAGAEVELVRNRLIVKLPAETDTDLLFAVARKSGARIRGLRLLRRSLEDVFLDALEVNRAG